MSDDIRTEVGDGIGRILLDRPHQRNASTPEMLAGLLRATQAFENDPAVRCVLVQGAGDHFMAGGNPKDFLDRLTTDRETYASGAEARVTEAHIIIRRLRRMPKPVLVSVQGSVAGFGFSLVLAADFAIAADTAFFAPAYNRIGLPGDGGVSYFLPRIVGERRAINIVMTGERITAAQALQWDIVTQVVPVEAHQAETDRLAAMLAAGPTQAYGMTKSLLRGSLDRSWEDQSALEADATARALLTDDHKEGLKAFVEKRLPRFTGS